MGNYLNCSITFSEHFDSFYAKCLGTLESQLMTTLQYDVLSLKYMYRTWASCSS